MLSRGGIEGLAAGAGGAICKCKSNSKRKKRSRSFGSAEVRFAQDDRSVAGLKMRVAFIWNFETIMRSSASGFQPVARLHLPQRGYCASLVNRLT